MGSFFPEKRDFIRLNIIPVIFIPSTKKTVLNIAKTLDYIAFDKKKYAILPILLPTLRKIFGDG